MNQIVIDAKGGAIGRIASFAAKQSLLGKSIIILNCNDALITGRKRETIDFYKAKRKRGGASLKGPFFPKSPERIMKRTVRGMLSYKQGRGSAAFKRIMCYNKTPAEFEKSEKTSLKRDPKSAATTLPELSKEP